VDFRAPDRQCQAMLRYDFTSDNTAAAAPEALEALARFNTGFTSGYGTDVVTAQAADAVRGLIDCDADVRFLPSGTAANAVALAALCRPFEAVLCHQHAHVITDEAGAPGFFGHGLGLIGLPGPSGRIDPAALAAALAEADDSHKQSPGALSLTNATEYGAVYQADEIRPLVDMARAKGLAVHLDGARLANAAAAGFDLTALKTLGIDIAVIGGTKAGLPLSEAVVLFDKRLSRRFDARLKQAGQLLSKGRFLAAPWIGMLESGAWLNGARHANAMAQKLKALIPFEIAHPVQANAIFVHMDASALKRLHDAGWDVHTFSDGTARFMCSWATTAEAVEEIGAVLKAIA
jgi:threonine aldolase